MRSFINIFACILDLLYPPRCCFCHKLTKGEKICKECENSLPYTFSNAKQTDISYISSAVSPLYYKDNVRKSVLRYKFHSATAYAAPYAELIAKCIDENGINCDIITWVPLSKQRLRSRGYNQAELIGREISGILDVPCAQLICKVRNNPAQSGTGNEARRKANVKGVYKAVDIFEHKGKSVLIIDDVITTGSTVSECAKVLKEHGYGLISAASLARSK